MAMLSSDITFTGSLGNLSAYRMKGSDGIILQTKVGGSKEKIKTSPSCINIRRVNAEFGGRSHATMLIRDAIGPINALADFNFTGHLNALLIPVQELDDTSEWGKRNIHLSKSPKLLEGFSLNKIRTFGRQSCHLRQVSVADRFFSLNDGVGGGAHNRRSLAFCNAQSHRAAAKIPDKTG